MSATTPDPSLLSGADPELDRLIEELTRRIQAGESVDLEAIAREHPGHAEPLRRLLPALEMLADLGQSVSAEGPRGHMARPDPITGLGELGDFRLVREIGRGGMGIVYEAEQISLRRRVALKVLPFAATLDARQIQRFQVEAQAAACLHHPHIVPVHGVGCDRGVHYYAMQLIDGQSLAAMIAELRRLDGLGPTDGPAPRLDEVSTSELAARLLWGGALDRPAGAGSEATTEGGSEAPTFALPAGASPPEAPTPRASLTGPDRPATAGSSTRNRDYVRGAARLALQAAEALDHAHARGIVHRDIKPGNLLLDAQGRLWITDFGLAQVRGDDRLTLSGDLLGTLRYMSPEQALGRRVAIDGRTDIYSLGVTLYELLTLQPAVDGRDRAEVLRRIAEREPAPPRRLNPAVPRDLQTILLKAMAKEPSARYATAKDLADDLRRFLEHRPILARRPTPLDRAAKWSRRHVAVVWSAVAMLTMTVVGLSTGLVLIEQQQRLTAREREILRWQLYVNRVNLAQREWSAGNPAQAEWLLDACPVELRNWEWHYCKRLCHLDLRTLRGHTRSVKAVAFSPDGALLVTGDGKPYLNGQARDSSELIVWDVRTGRQVRRLRGFQGTVHSVAFSPDGMWIAVGSGYYDRPPGGAGRVTIWEASSGRLLFEKCLPHLNALSVAFSPDGARVAAGFGLYSSDYQPGRLVLWEVATGREVLNVTSAPGGVNDLSVHPDGQRIALACMNVVEIWTVGSRRKVREIPGHTGWIYGLAFSPDGKRLATAGWDRAIRLWDPQTGSLLLTIDKHNGFVNSVAFSPDGTRLASASEDHIVRIWDSTSGRELLALHGHDQSVTGVAFSPDGKRLASTGEDGSVKVWDALSDRQVTFRKHRGWVTSVAFSPDGELVASSSGDGTVALWDPSTGRRFLKLEGRSGWVNSVAFSPDGKRLASAAEYGQVHIWDRSSGRRLQAFEQLDAYVRGVAFSPDGTLLAACTGAHDFLENVPGQVYVWTATTGAEVLRFRGHSGRVIAMAFSPDSRRIASVDEPRGDQPQPPSEILLWGARTGDVVRRIQGPRRPIRCLAFSLDGRWLASGSEDGRVQLWDAASGVEIRTMAASTQSKSVASLAFSPDSTRLASATYEQAVKLWDPASGQEMFTLHGHTTGVVCLAFSRDGRRLASGGNDWMAEIWDATPLGPEMPDRGDTAAANERR
jgi:eukaryotic-like serine/threonine-protein kinase